MKTTFYIETSRFAFFERAMNNRKQVVVHEGSGYVTEINTYYGFDEIEIVLTPLQEPLRVPYYMLDSPFTKMLAETSGRTVEVIPEEPEKEPTEEGRKRHHGGKYENYVCTCVPECEHPCKGACDCKACNEAYQDYLSNDWV